MSSSLTGVVTNTQIAGGFRVFVSPPVGARVEISMFRGAPVMVTQWSFADPFSEEVAVLSCPQITAFDTPGSGDLGWLVGGSDVDIIWQPMPGSPITTAWSWEGHIASFDFGLDDQSVTFQIQLRGAIYALDNYLALPSFPAYPLPFEFLLRSAFDPEQHPCSLNPLDMAFPDWWNTVAPGPVAGENPLLRPAGVTTGSPWTGLTSRSTGSWNPLLTGFVSSLLQNMYNADGSQWTIRNRGNRAPQLMVREQASDADPGVLNVDLGAPGVGMQLSMDFTQQVNVVYGTGTDNQGVAYSGLQMSADGQSISYIPFAYNPAAYPRSGGGVNNPAFNPNQKMRESYAAFQSGLTAPQASAVAQGQLSRLNDPGMTGSITLTSDPYLSDAAGSPFLRLLIREGSSIRVNGLLGIPEGVLFHVGEVSVDPVSMTTTLTVDNKYRDILTIDEVHARTMDPLKLLHQLQSGADSNTIKDLLLPWSYADGSGAIPYGAAALFNSMPASATFPYSTPDSSGWCQQYPPSTHPEYYVRIGPTDQNDAANNWADASSTRGAAPGTQPGIPVLMSAKGTAAQIQVAAYDASGNVLPVKFHLSLYTSNGVTVDAMPLWGPNPYLTPANTFPPILGPTSFADANSASFLGRWPGGAGGQAWPSTDIPVAPYSQSSNVHHPFFQGAWQSTDEQGHSFAGVTQYTPNPDTGPIVGWGTFYIPAGFYPSEPGSGSPTGMLVDGIAWDWDTGVSLNPQSLDPVGTAQYGASSAGRIYAMIYCEDQGQQPVYFLGRIYAQSQGGSTT